ncbi:MAG TPA: alanine racemase [Capsulimonadaceae bacterium]|jgi:alanine racemase
MTDSSPQFEPNAWIEIDSDALTSNAIALREFVTGSASSPELIAVVKADGYGHGAVTAAKAFTAGGVGRFAVTTLDEAAALVRGGIDPAVTPILVFAPIVTPSQANAAALLGVEPTICDPHHVRLLVAAAETTGRVVNVHLKVDTGMGRLGDPPIDACRTARLIAATPALKLVGTYTHFANASDTDLASTRAALARFTGCCDALSADGISPGLRHAANSAATLRLPEARLDAVRLGTVLYGQYPSAAVPKVPNLNANTWQAKARVVFVHNLPAGATVGYGSEVTLRKPTRVAVIAIGYADGYEMSPNSMFKGQRGVNSLVKQALGNNVPRVYLHDTAAPVLGRVAMQMIVVDVTALGDKVKEGDIANVPMRRLAASAHLPRVETT